MINRLQLALFTVFALLFGSASNLWALTDMQAGYFMRTSSGGAPVDRPEIYWANPGNVTFANRFCTYRTQPLPPQTDRLGVYTSYATTSFADSAFETADYSGLSVSGILHYWGVLGQSCQNVANGAGLTPTTNTASAVPLVHYSGARSDGTTVSLTINNPTNYTRVFTFAIPQEISPPQPFYIVGRYDSANAAQGSHAVSFPVAGLPSGFTFKLKTMAVTAPVDEGLLNPAVCPPPVALADRASCSWIDPSFTFDNQPPPQAPPPTDLNASIYANPADVRLTWQNAATYQNIRVYVNGTMIEEIQGDRTSYDFNNQPFGESFTYGLSGIPAVGLPSEIASTPAPVTGPPAPPTILAVSGSDIGFTLLLQAPSGNYAGPNAIQGVFLRWVNTATAQQYNYSQIPSALNPTATYSIVTPAGTYQVFARITAHGESSAETSPVTVTVTQPQGAKVFVKHTPDHDAQGKTNPDLYYRVSFILSDAQRTYFSYVKVFDTRSGQLLAVLNAANGFEATKVPICNPGEFRFSSIGYLPSGAASPTVVRSRYIPAMANDAWTWITSESTDNTGHRAVLRVRSNLPACSTYPLRSLYVLDANVQQGRWTYTYKNIAMGLGQDVIETTFNYPKNHSKDGHHRYYTWVRFGDSDASMYYGLANWTYMNLGSRPFDADGNDHNDWQDFWTWIIYYYIPSHPMNTLSDPNTVNFDRDRFVWDQRQPLNYVFNDCGRYPDYQPEGISEMYQDQWNTIFWLYFYYSILYGWQPARNVPQGYYAHAVPNDPNSPNACIALYNHNEAEGSYNQFGLITRHGPNQAGYPSQVDAMGFQNRYHNH